MIEEYFILKCLIIRSWKHCLMPDNNRFGSWLWMDCEESSKRTDDVWSWNSRSSWLDLWRLKSISKIKSFTYCSVKFPLRFSLSARWSVYEDTEKRNRAWKMWRWCMKKIILILFNINNIKMANIIDRWSDYKCHSIRRWKLSRKVSE